MRSLKVMSIIGIVLSGVVFLGMMAFYSDNDAEAAMGLAVWAVLWLLAQSISSLVISCRNK